MGPELAPGTHIGVMRRNGETNLVQLTKAEDGQPLHPDQELVSLGDPACDCGHVRSFTSLHHEGPAQVATPAYREGYDRIFGKKPVTGLA